jgi:hypothetical protein
MHFLMDRLSRIVSQKQYKPISIYMYDNHHERRSPRIFDSNFL